MTLAERINQIESAIHDGVALYRDTLALSAVARAAAARPWRETNANNVQWCRYCHITSPRHGYACRYAALDAALDALAGGA